MTAKEKQIIREVIYATDLHFTILDNNRRNHARINQDTLSDIVQGMAISLEKLEQLVK